MESCIYQGTVAHARHGSVAHRFRYSLFMVYLDLDELPGLLKRLSLLSAARFAPAAFRRSDHLGDAAQPLGESVRRLVEQQTGSRPDGPIRLLTQLRYWGHYFSPLNLYYCFPRDGGPPEALVAEVNNTPWGERHCYVLWDGNRVSTNRGDRDGGRQQRFRHAKAFHVSPFLGMDADYHWRITAPDSRLGVHIQSREAGRPVFDATLNLQRTPLSDRALAANLVRFPFMTIKIVGAIYFEAFRLWLKQAPFFPHPRKLASGNPAPSSSPSASDEQKTPAPVVSVGPTGS